MSHYRDNTIEKIMMRIVSLGEMSLIVLGQSAIPIDVRVLLKNTMMCSESVGEI